MPGINPASCSRDPALPPLVERIIRAIADAGGRAYLVGGGVRDLYLGRETRDLDIEVHRLALDGLEAVLRRFGAVDLVGKQFGVLCLHGVKADWSVPRKDSCGRHPTITPDPWMGMEEAARRRDLTVNAMALDPLDQTLHDPFGGLADLEKGVLRAPDEKRFVEDPLRFFRVMRFIGQLEMDPDLALSALCRSMGLRGIAAERIEEEFARLFLRSRFPSRGLRWLEELDRLQEILPEVAPLVGLEQDPLWHPEGDAWTHTLQVVDAAVGLKTGDRGDDLMFLWAALCHDLGKAQTTVFERGHIRSPGHTDLSGELAETLLKRIVSNRKVIKGAVKLALHHLKPHDFFANQATPKGFKRLALALAPETSLERLATLALADFRGRNPKGSEPLEIDSRESAWFIERAEALKVMHEPEKPVLMGRHLLDRIQPGPELGRLLKRAYEIQLNEGLKDVEALKARVLDGEEG